MNVYIADRKTGKTTILVKISAETGAIIVVPTYHMIKEVENIAKELGLEIPKPIDTSQFMRELHSFTNKRYLVDELQMVLGLMGIEAATLDIDSAWIGRVKEKNNGSIRKYLF